MGHYYIYLQCKRILAFTRKNWLPCGNVHAQSGNHDCTAYYFNKDLEG